MTPAPNLDVNEALFRAAMHFTAKGDEAAASPARTGVRIERSGTRGVYIVAMSRIGAIFLHDPIGSIQEDATIRMPRAFFDGAKRASIEVGQSAKGARLCVKHGMASLNPGGDYFQRAEAIEDHAFPDWREALPGGASKLFAPPVEPESTERADTALRILWNAGLCAKVQHFRSDDGAFEITHFGDVGFVLLDAVDTGVSPLPWRFPLWLSKADQQIEAAS